MFLLKKNTLIVAAFLVMSMSLLACSGEKHDSNNDNVNYAEYVGEYQDSFSQRASMDVEDLGDSLKLKVHWSSSADESAIWTMTAKFTSPNTLSYADCEYGIIEFDEDGNDSYTKEYDCGEGYFTLKDGKLYWDGAADMSCIDCVFEKE